MWKQINQAKKFYQNLKKLSTLDLNKTAGKKTGKTTKEKPRDKRLDAKTLQDLYTSDPLVYNTANIYSYFATKGMKIVTKNEKWKKELEEFWDKANLNKKAEDTVRWASLNGMCAWEFVYSLLKKEELVGIGVINPINFDYMKGTDGKILFDPITGKPVGWTQKVGYDITINFPPMKGDNNFDKDSKKTKEDYVLPFIFNAIDGLYGVGFVEPSYDVLMWRRKVLKGLRENMFRHGFMQFDIGYGDAKHQNYQTMIDQGETTFENLYEDSEIHHPDYVKVTPIQPAGYRGIVDGYSVFLDEYVAATGIPKGVLMGQGQGASFSETEKVTQQNFLMKIDSLRQNMLSEPMEDQLFPKILGVDITKGKPKDFPKLEFDELVPEDFINIVKEREIDLKYNVKTVEEIRTERGIEGPAPEVKQKEPDFFQFSSLQDDSKPELDVKIISLQSKYSEDLTNELVFFMNNIERRINQTLKLKKLAANPKDLDNAAKIVNSELESFQASAIKISVDHAEQTFLATTSVISTEFPDLNINLKKSQIDLEAIEFFKKNGADRIKGITDAVRNGVKNEITIGLMNGESERQIASRLSHVMNVSKPRLNTIARTETKRAYDEISFNKFKDAGVEMVEWATAGDERVRPHHADLDGNRWPMDSGAIPRDILSEPNCRCILLPVISEAEEILS